MPILSRRSALKALLAAAGGAGASLFLPEKWLIPAVKTGVIPAHAQSSVSCSSIHISWMYWNAEVWFVFNLPASQAKVDWTKATYEVLSAPVFTDLKGVTLVYDGKIDGSDRFYWSDTNFCTFTAFTGDPTITTSLRLNFPDGKSSCVYEFTNQKINYM